MMNCREAAKILGGRTQLAAPAAADAARQHLAACADCRCAWSLEQLAATLIREYAAPQASESNFPSPYFFARLRARIQAESADPGTAFWEVTVATARGWLLAFGSVTAILLTAFMLTWRGQTNALEFSSEALALPASRENLVIANHEPLSHDAVLELFADEDYDHARK